MSRLNCASPLFSLLVTPAKTPPPPPRPPFQPVAWDDSSCTDKSVVLAPLTQEAELLDQGALGGAIAKLIEAAEFDAKVPRVGERGVGLCSPPRTRSHH